MSMFHKCNIVFQQKEHIANGFLWLPPCESYNSLLNP